MLKKASRSIAKFFIWLAEGIHYETFTDKEGRTYYGIANKKEF